jgi:hypothetical protein
LDFFHYGGFVVILIIFLDISFAVITQVVD